MTRASPSNPRLERPAAERLITAGLHVRPAAQPQVVRLLSESM